MDKKCLIIDDIIDTGETVLGAASLLKQDGAEEINLILTHGVLSRPVVPQLKQSYINKIFISNSIEHSFNLSEIKQIDVIPLITESLQQILAQKYSL